MQNNLYYLFLTFVILGMAQGCEKPKITAELKYSIPKQDSLVISIKLQNQSKEPLFLVCKVNEIGIDNNNTIPIHENYNCSPEEQFEMFKKIARDFVIDNNERSNLKDTIWLSLPKVEKRYQVNHAGDNVDIFEIINNLEEAYYILKRDDLAPIPPNVKDINEYFYTDIDLYNLIKQEKINDEKTWFYQDVIILKPNEIKTFYIDVSYLLLQKATYRLFFDFKTIDTIFTEEEKKLQKLGFNRFKGHIISNEIEIKSARSEL